MTINNDNVEKIKMLADRLTYTVQSVEKIADVSQYYGDCAFDFYKDDMNYLYSEISGDIVAVININSREYSNILASKDEKQINNNIDLNRVKGLTVKEYDCIDYACIDLACDDWLDIEYTDELTQNRKDIIRKKILASIDIEKVTARGYCQGDWDKYVIVSYKKTISKVFSDYYNNFIKNLEYLFTVTEYNISLVHKETRLYTSGIVEVEEVEIDSTGEICYDGEVSRDTIKDLEAQGYIVEFK